MATSNPSLTLATRLGAVYHPDPSEVNRSDVAIVVIMYRFRAMPESHPTSAPAATSQRNALTMDQNP